MSRIDWLNWGIALTLSVSLHAMFILYKNLSIIHAPASNIQHNITHISFSRYAPIVEKEVIEQKIVTPIQPEPELKPQPEPEPQPITLPKPKPKPKPDLMPKPKPQPKPASRPKQQPNAHLKQQQAVKMQSRQPFAAAAAKQSDPELLNRTRLTYHALLLRHIEVHKIYPKAARRRKIEGRIQVTFTLFADGSIKHLTINGKRSVLKRASRQAIDGALPMPKPPAQLSLPMKVEFTMNYFLK